MKDSGADASQIGSVSEVRLVRRIGRIAESEIEQIAVVIALSVGFLGTFFGLATRMAVVGRGAFNQERV